MDQKTTPHPASSETPAAGSEPRGTSSDATTALKQGLATTARDIKTETRHVVEDLAGEAKKAASTRLDAGKDFAAEHLGSVAQALRHTGQQLRQEQSGIHEYVEKAATSVDRVSSYLQTRTLSQLIGDVESYARREPAVYLGGMFFAGVLGGRFFKAATPARPAARQVDGWTRAPEAGRQTPQPASGQPTRSAPTTRRPEAPAMTPRWSTGSPGTSATTPAPQVPPASPSPAAGPASRPRNGSAALTPDGRTPGGH